MRIFATFWLLALITLHLLRTTVSTEEHDSAPTVITHATIINPRTSSVQENRAVVIIGEVYDPTLSIGGGPMPPGSGASPPGIWGPPGPWPTPPFHPGGQPPAPAHPIVIPPGTPGVPPGSPAFPIWGPPGISFPPGEGYPPVAGHPLPPGETAPDPIENWAAVPVWTAENGWGVVIVPTGDQPIPTPSKK